MASIRVLLVDDSEFFLAAAAKLLALQAEIEIIGRATSGEDAVAKARAWKPQLVLMDWEMPGMNGLQAMKIMKKFSNPPRVVLMSLHDFAEYRAAALAQGADGFWSKMELCERASVFLTRTHLSGMQHDR